MIFIGCSYGSFFLFFISLSFLAEGILLHDTYSVFVIVCFFYSVPLFFSWEKSLEKSKECNRFFLLTKLATSYWLPPWVTNFFSSCFSFLERRQKEQHLINSCHRGRMCFWGRKKESRKKYSCFRSLSSLFVFLLFQDVTEGYSRVWVRLKTKTRGRKEEQICSSQAREPWRLLWKEARKA